MHIDKMVKRFFFLYFISFGLSAYAQEPVDLKTELDSLERIVPGLGEEVNFTLANAPLSELLRGIAETHDLNVSLNGLPEILITNNFNNVLVKDLILFVCQEHNLKVRFVNNILSFYREQPPEVPADWVSLNPSTGLVTVRLQSTSLIEFAKELTQETDYNLIVSSELFSQSASIYMREVSIEDALQQLADVHGWELEKKRERIWQLNKPVVVATQQQGGRNSGRTNRPTNQTRRGPSNYDLKTYQKDGKDLIFLSSSGTPVATLLEAVSTKLKIDYVLLSEITGTMDCRVDSIEFEDFLELTLEPSSLSFTVNDEGIYLIGASNSVGLNEASIFYFKNRSLEGIEKVIPEELLAQVKIKPFNDLNALVVTGSDRNVRKLHAFLEQVDRPIPNVLIEVIVMEVSKGYSLRTGIQAFLGDSTVTSQGQVFGGVDATLSSESINRILSNLDDRGIMNLGQVTPRFYATLQAMEDNNNIEIQSTPKLSTLNGHEATLQIGQSQYYLVETQNVTGGVNPIVTVTPRYENVEANLSLKITPYVSELEDVTLSIEAEFSDFIAPTIDGAPPGNASRKFISKIRVKNQETVVLGGLEEASDVESGSGTPVLSRIPILKWIFSSRVKDESEGKLMIFIKPTIVY